MASNDTSIRYFRFDNKGAPQLSNVWGCMIEVLNACLVNGFGDQPVSSIVIANGVGTATFPTAHAINLYQVVSFAGTGIVALHTEFKVLGVTTNTVQFLVNLPDQTVNGSITCRLPGLGWSQPYYGIHKAVYRAKDTLANPFYLRVDNSLDPAYDTTYAKFAKVGMLETCSGMDDLSGRQAPFDPSLPTANWIGTGSGTTVVNGWFKWYYATHDSTAISQNYYESEGAHDGIRQWILIGTKDSFYIINNTIRSTNTNTLYAPYGFCATQHRGICKPYLFATDRYGPAQTDVKVNSGLSTPRVALVASYYSYTDAATNTTPFIYTYPGIGGVGNSGGATGALGYDEALGFMLTDLYVMDMSNYLLPPIPYVKYTPNNATAVANYTLYAQPDKCYIGVGYRTSSGGLPGMLFFQIYNGAPL